MSRRCHTALAEGKELLTCKQSCSVPKGHGHACRPSEVLNFYEVLLRARARQEIIIGYKNFGMDKPVVNPKNKEERILSVDLTDTLVVLSLGLEPEKVRIKEKNISAAAKAQDPNGYGDWDASRPPSFSASYSKRF